MASIVMSLFREVSFLGTKISAGADKRIDDSLQECGNFGEDWTFDQRRWSHLNLEDELEEEASNGQVSKSKEEGFLSRGKISLISGAWYALILGLRLESKAMSELKLKLLKTA